MGKHKFPHGSDPDESGERRFDVPSPAPIGREPKKRVSGASAHTNKCERAYERPRDGERAGEKIVFSLKARSIF